MEIQISMLSAILKRQPNNAWIKPDGSLMYVAVDNAIVELRGEEGEFLNLTDHQIMSKATEAFRRSRS